MQLGQATAPAGPAGGWPSSPPCGPAAVTRVPATHSSTRTPTVAQVSRRSGRGTTMATGGSSVSPQPDQHDDGDEEQEQREQHVRGHRPPGEPGAHRDAAPHRLEQHAQRQHGGQPGQPPAARRAPAATPGRCRAKERAPRRSAVRLVNSIAWWNAARPDLVTGTSEPGLALRPGHAAQPGTGDPDGRTGDRDAAVGEHRQRRPADAGRGGVGHRGRHHGGGVAGRSATWPAGRGSLPSEPPYGADPADDDPAGQHTQMSRVGAPPACRTARRALDRAPAGVSSPTVRSQCGERVSGSTTPPTSTNASQIRLAKGEHRLGAQRAAQQQRQAR